MYKHVTQCTVCCHYYGRDRDLFERQGVWDCESNDPREAPLDCGFSVPIGTSPEQIRRLAEQRIVELEAMRAPKVKV